MENDEVRKRFEAWYKREFGVDVSAMYQVRHNYYLDSEGVDADTYWLCYQAAYADARAQALDEAAEICETAPDRLQNSTFDGAAEAIRKLKGPTALRALEKRATAIRAFKKGFTDVE